MWRHLKWRWSQRRRGILWWALLGRLALFSSQLFRRPAKSPNPPAPHTDVTPGISLIIPTRDGRDLLASMLPPVIADLAAHTAEIIVVDNGS